MKKLLLLLLLSLGFLSSADAMTRCSDGSYVSGTSCQRAPNGTYVSGRSYGNSYNSGSSGAGAAANYEAGALMGNTINKLINSLDSSNNNNSNSYTSKRIFDFGTKWSLKGGVLRGSNGIVCSDYPNMVTCNNRVNYWQCGNKLCGSDGTSYSFIGMCVSSSFGSYCCNDGIGSHAATCQ